MIGVVHVRDAPRDERRVDGNNEVAFEMELLLMLTAYKILMLYANS